MTRLTDKTLLNGGRKALGEFHKAIDNGLVEKSTLELAKIRASQMNGCAVCLTTHWNVALELGERVERLATVVVWRECDWFTPREKAALAWTEALTATADGHVSDEMYQEVRQHFSQEEVVALTWTIISINSWNRINIAFATQPTPVKVPGVNAESADEQPDDSAASESTSSDESNASSNEREAAPEAESHQATTTYTSDDGSESEEDKVVTDEE